MGISVHTAEAEMATTPLPTAVLYQLYSPAVYQLYST